jgi:very-short-patch-repair endonuclease
MNALIAYALRHDGVFTTADARECGVTHRMLERRNQRGEIIRIHRGVYRFAHVPVTPMQRVRAALAMTNGKVVASHSSAAMLLGLSDVSLATPEMTVTTRRGHVPQRVGVRVHTSRDLPTQDQTHVRGFPCTTGSRTLIDLCPRYADVVNIQRADHAICAGIAARGTLHTRATALSNGRQRVRALAEITAPDADGTFWSALERAFGTNIRRYELPIPEYNAPFDIAGRRYYADAFWQCGGLVAELHGLAFHAHPADRADDDERMNALTSTGLRVLVFRWNHVMHEFDHVANTIHRALSIDTLRRQAGRVGGDG